MSNIVKKVKQYGTLFNWPKWGSYNTEFVITRIR